MGSKKKKIILISVLSVFVLGIGFTVVNRNNIDFSKLMGNSLANTSGEYYYCPLGNEFDVDSKECVVVWNQGYGSWDPGEAAEDWHEIAKGKGYEYLDSNYNEETKIDTIHYRIKKDIKMTKGTYVCPKSVYSSDKYNLNGNKCIKTVTQDAKVEYTCPSGYQKNGNRCIKTVGQGAKEQYSCPSGYQLNGTKCTKNASKAAGIKYTCSSGYKYTQGTCVQTITKNATKKKNKYTCPSGYKLSGKKCTKKNTKSATFNYTCSSGYQRNGSKCIKTETINATRNYTCPNGYNLNGTNCTKQESISVTTKYICPSGYQKSGTKCTKNEAPIPAIHKCPQGYYDHGTICSTNPPGEGEYTCVKGDKTVSKTYDGKIVCEHIIKYMHICPDGYTDYTGKKYTINTLNNPNHNYVSDSSPCLKVDRLKAKKASRDKNSQPGIYINLNTNELYWLSELQVWLKLMPNGDYEPLGNKYQFNYYDPKTGIVHFYGEGSTADTHSGVSYDSSTDTMYWCEDTRVDNYDNCSALKKIIGYYNPKTGEKHYIGEGSTAGTKSGMRFDKDEATMYWCEDTTVDNNDNCTAMENILE